jgi:hypothetical protein
MKRRYSALNEMYDEIEVAIQKDPILNANGDFKTLMQDNEFLRNYHLREMAFCDWVTGIDTAYEKGAIEAAKRLFKAGLSIDIIHKITELDMETIQALMET